MTQTRRILWTVIATGLIVLLVTGGLLFGRHQSAHSVLQPCRIVADRNCVQRDQNGGASWIDSDWQGHELISP